MAFAGNNLPDEWYDDTGSRVTRMTDAIHAAASRIVFNTRGGTLLQERADNGWWGLLLGYIDVGEWVEQGAIRGFGKRQE